MAGKLHTKSKDVMQIIRDGMTRHCVQTAHHVLTASNRNISSNSGAEGLALGPGSKEMDLVASGYIATASRNGYDSARAAASFGRDAKRGLWADRAEVLPIHNGVRVKVAYALQRADLMHNGYYDRQAEKFMHGEPFLLNALRSEWDDFFKGAAEVVRETQTVRFLTAEEQRDEDIAKQLADWHRAATKDMAEQWTNFKNSYGHTFKRQRGAQKGVRKIRGVKGVPFLKPVYSWESAAERLERITDSFRDYVSTGGQMSTNVSTRSFSSGPDDLADFVASRLRSGR